MGDGKGGFWKGETYGYEEVPNTTCTPVFLWGYLLHEPRIIRYKNKKKKDRERVSAHVRYRNGKSLNVVAYGENNLTRTLKMLKTHDKVFVAGEILEITSYIDGFPSTKRELDPYIIIPEKMVVTALTMSVSPRFRDLLQDDFESDGDYDAKLHDNSAV